MEDLSRRKLLLGLGAFALSPRFILAMEKGKSVRLGLLHDENLCIGCTACMDACREVNRIPEGVARLEIIRSEPFGEFPEQHYQFFRYSCQHCSNAPCVAVCPTGASFIDIKNGIVDVNADLCVGCSYCIAVCPYRVRYIDPVKKTADKCNFCRDTNLAQGKLPACVEACPTKALIFGDLNDPQSEIAKTIQTNPTYRSKVHLGTEPNLYRIQRRLGEYFK